MTVSKAGLTRRSFVAAGAGVAVMTPRIRRARAANQEITIALSSNSLAYGGLNIAQKAGLFEKHGLHPHIIRMDSGNAATSALIGGSVQFCGSGMEEVLAARSRGQNIVIIENVYRGISAVLVVSKDKATKMGISPDAPPAERLKALDGTAIATPSATSGFNAPVQAATAKYGAKINFLFIAQPAMVAALESGAISAFMASSPFWEPAVLQNYGTVWLTTPKPGELPDEFVPISVAVLQATEEYAHANPEPIAKLRAVFDELAVLIKEQPDAARKLLSQCYPEVDPRSLTLAYDINSDNWTHPNITPADIDHQFKITEAAGVIKGLDKIDRKTIVWPAG